jgi:hypothetical protein
LIDARKQPWNGAAIGNGSRLVIAYVIHAWDRPEGVGITLIPRAAQGFQEQEGYSQAEAALADGEYDEFASDEEVPF